MALVTPLSPEHDLETKELAEFFNETLGFCPNSVLTMQRRPAISKAFINLNKILHNGILFFVQIFFPTSYLSSF